jgi:hypothetical protein
MTNRTKSNLIKDKTHLNMSQMTEHLPLHQPRCLGAFAAKIRFKSVKPVSIKAAKA